jgi:hypothetical protein
MPSKMAQNLKRADLFALVWRVWKTLGQKQKVGHHATGGKVRGPTWNAFLAEAMALTGNIDSALQLIDEVIDQIERPGWVVWEAE